MTPPHRDTDVVNGVERVLDRVAQGSATRRQQLLFGRTSPGEALRVVAPRRVTKKFPLVGRRTGSSRKRDGSPSGGSIGCRRADHCSATRGGSRAARGSWWNHTCGHGRRADATGGTGRAAHHNRSTNRPAARIALGRPLKRYGGVVLRMGPGPGNPGNGRPTSRIAAPA
jgi:hypothetical protein